MACTNNILINGDFETGDLSNWNKFSDGTATFNNIANSAVINVTAGASNTQFYQANVSVIAGQTFEFSVTASASANVTVPVYLIKHTSPYTNLGLNQPVLLSLTPTIQTFTIAFTATQTETNGRLRFVFNGINNNVITLDDICIGSGTLQECAVKITSNGLTTVNSISPNNGSTSVLNSQTFTASDDATTTHRRWEIAALGSTTFVEFGTGATATYNFNTAQTYTIRLTSGGPNGCAITTTTFTVTDTVQALFTFSPTNAEPNQNVTFTDNSTPASSIINWLWEFGDGFTSTVKNPVHKFNNSGTYPVKLTVSTASSTDSVTQNVTINEAIEMLKPSFTKNLFNVVTAQTVTFTDTSTADNPITSWLWDFGDNSYSSLQNPTHSFGSSGIYPVTLTITSIDGQVTSTQQFVLVNEFTPSAATPNELMYYDETRMCMSKIPPAPSAGYVLTATTNGYAWVLPD